ncbi:MAG: hypothetical protein HZA91_18095 [Verrucomicrobia bacterium]|nr:hypothetical protein [Verrucomicrobiota bacterium]
MSIDTVQQVEVIPGRGKICFYLDKTARALEAEFPPPHIEGPEGLTGDERLDRVVWTLLLAAKNTNTYWGFDYEGYRRLVDYFVRPDYDEDAATTKAPEMDRATRASISDVVRTEKDLALLVDDGWLRAEPYKSPEGRIAVYFITAKLASNAVGARRPAETRPRPARAKLAPSKRLPQPPPTSSLPQIRIAVRGSHSYITAPRLRPIL